MKRRREKGVILAFGIILLCTLFFLIFPKEKEKDKNTADKLQYDQMEKENELQDEAIDQMDTRDSVLEEQREEEYDVAQNMSLLSYKRSGNQRMIFLFAGILICYLIVIGPLSYFYTKSVDQKEKVWVLIPIAALFFGCLVLCFADSFAVRQPQLDILTIERPESQTEVYISVTSAGKKNSRIFFNNLVDSVDYFSIVGRYELMADQKGVVIQPDYVFEKDYLHLLLTEQSGSFSCEEEQNIKKSKKEKKIQLRNETGSDFSYVLVCRNEKYVLLSSVGQGEEIQIQEEEWISGTDGYKKETGGILRMKTKLTKDEEKLFRYVMEEYEKKNQRSDYLVAIRTDGEDGIIEQGLDILSYSLYYQDLK